MAWSIAGKTVVVTGATNGIGEAAAIALAKAGAHVALVGRSKERGEASLAKVKAAGDSNARLFLADLSSLADVRRLGAELNALPRIDVLLNNAGAVFTDRGVTVDGFERTFALNHLAYFLLTKLLLDKLKAASQARVINVSSEAHRQGKINFDDLQSEKSYGTFSVYGTSKLENILFTRELAKRLAGTGVTVYAMHPGVVATGFGRNNSGFFSFLIKLAAPFMRTPEKAARTAVFLASDPGVEAENGKYFKDSRLTTPTARAQNDADAAKLWEVSEQLIVQKRAAA
jgi:NAD(P)-dependent dehydrogenase (short-subunit alcohol dehydrogenase family)